MTKQEFMIYESCAIIKTALESIDYLDVIEELLKCGPMVSDTDFENIDDLEIESLVSNVEIIFNGEVTWESESHYEQDWNDNGYYEDVRILDEIINDVKDFDGILTGTINGHTMKASIRFGKDAKIIWE